MPLRETILYWGFVALTLAALAVVLGAAALDVAEWAGRLAR